MVDGKNGDSGTAAHLDGILKLSEGLLLVVDKSGEGLPINLSVPLESENLSDGIVPTCRGLVCQRNVYGGLNLLRWLDKELGECERRMTIDVDVLALFIRGGGGIMSESG